VKDTAVAPTPLHTVWLAGTATVGVGFTVIVKLCATPVQLFAEAYINYAGSHNCAGIGGSE